MGRLRITFLLPAYGFKPVGGFKVVYEYANRLASQGHEISVVHAARLRRQNSSTPLELPRRMRQLAYLRRNAPSRPTWIETHPDVKFLYKPSLAARHIPRGDAVFATAWQTAEEVLLYPADRGERFYLIQGYETWSGSKDRVDRTWRSDLNKVVIAQWLYRLGQDLGVEDLTYIPNAIDPLLYPMRTPNHAREASVAMLANPAPEKGMSTGLAALRLVKIKVPSLRALLFGTDQPPPGLPDWIDYHQEPRREDLVDLYNRAAVYLCPSFSEGWHLPPAEAMSCGAALVSSDIGGVADYAEQGVTAMLAKPGDSSELAELVTTLLQDVRLRSRVAEAGRRRIVESFSWEESVTRLEGFMRECIRRT